MPYVSKAQQRKFHVLESEGKIPHSVVKEFDEATKGHYSQLPEHVKKKKKRKKQAEYTLRDVLNGIRRVAYRTPLRAILTNAALGLGLGRYVVPYVIGKMNARPEAVQTVKSIGTILGPIAMMLPISPLVRYELQRNGWSGLTTDWALDSMRERQYNKRYRVPSNANMKMSALDTEATIGKPYLDYLLENDPYLDSTQHLQAQRLFNMAAQQDATRTGLISAADIGRAALGAGLGYGTALIGSKLLGKFFGLSNQAQQKATRLGILGGILANSGLINW